MLTMARLVLDISTSLDRSMRAWAAG